jgi:hypothetical protein
MNAKATTHPFGAAMEPINRMAAARGSYVPTFASAIECSSSMSRDITYNIHILIGLQSDGVMIVIADWPHVPPFTDVELEIHGVRHRYIGFVLCTPTSILPAGSGEKGEKQFGFHRHS